MKIGKLTHWIEVPIEVEYRVNPAEKMTMTYPGCDASLEIEGIMVPTAEEIGRLVDGELEQIKVACWEDANQPPDDGI